MAALIFMKQIQINNRDLATILAALRYYQEQGMADPCNRWAHIDDVATDHGRESALDDAGIDDLCERLNTEPGNELLDACKVMLPYLPQSESALAIRVRAIIAKATGEIQ